MHLKELRYRETFCQIQTSETLKWILRLNWVWWVQMKVCCKRSCKLWLQIWRCWSGWTVSLIFLFKSKNFHKSLEKWSLSLSALWAHYSTFNVKKKICVHHYEKVKSDYQQPCLSSSEVWFIATRIFMLLKFAKKNKIKWEQIIQRLDLINK